MEPEHQMDFQIALIRVNNFSNKNLGSVSRRRGFFFFPDKLALGKGLALPTPA
jgi:hypothetical protein